MCRTEEEDGGDEELSSLAPLWECWIDGNLIEGADDVERREALSL